MSWHDYVVLAVYFATLVGIGVYCARRVKAQEDFFMGGRGFGKLLQTFAAFGAGTGSSDPVNTGRTTFTSGMSGMWSVMYWLFVTPFYWITGVWYRRMRHLTLGDWFVERYESRRLGAAYALFGLFFMVFYGAMLFAAIGQVAAPLVDANADDIAYVLVPVIGIVVLAYGLAGGLSAAYFTDLVQGICIILLSIILIPFGLDALVEKFGTDQDALMDGFRIMHERVPEDYFNVIGSSNSSEFPLHRIIAVVIINLIGVVIQPHFIATGGGSAKTETTARVGLVVGNFLKRFCTVGWVLTAMIALALFSDSPELAEHPDRTWGVASRELLGPGLRGLMLACLLAALMSSIDAYMVVGSGLVVRNIYAPFMNPNATEAQYVRVARFTGVFIVAGAVLVALSSMDVFALLQYTWVIPILFAATFWVGMFWRGATTAAAWGTIAFVALTFFVLPIVLPVVAPGLRDSCLDVNEFAQVTTERSAAQTDVDKRQAAIAVWTAKRAQAKELGDAVDMGPQPAPLEIGATIKETKLTGGASVFWGSVRPIDEQGSPIVVERVPQGEPQVIDEKTTRVVLAYPDGTRLRGEGSFKMDFLIYSLIGIDLSAKDSSWLKTLELPLRIVMPFLVMILLSLLTKKNSQAGLDAYYAKMKTPVDPDPQEDRRLLDEALANPAALEQKKLFPGSNFEFGRPSLVDIVGFVVCVALCFAVIGAAVWVAGIGA